MIEINRAECKEFHKTFSIVSIQYAGKKKKNLSFYINSVKFKNNVKCLHKKMSAEQIEKLIIYFTTDFQELCNYVLYNATFKLNSDHEHQKLLISHTLKTNDQTINLLLKCKLKSSLLLIFLKFRLLLYNLKYGTISFFKLNTTRLGDPE